MITKTDFENAIRNECHNSNCGLFTDEAAKSCYELAKKMAMEFAKWYAGNRDKVRYLDFTVDQLFTEYQNQKQ